MSNSLRSDLGETLYYTLGETIVLPGVFEEGEVDLTDCVITSTIKTDSGNGVVAASFNITKTSQTSFTMTLESNVTSTLSSFEIYGFDIKFVYPGNVVNRSPRVLLKFNLPVTT